MIDYHKQLTMKDPGVPKVEKEFSWMSRSTLLKIKVSKVGFSSDAIEEPFFWFPKEPFVELKGSMELSVQIENLSF